METSMRKLVVTENITVDGVIDASEGWFAPSDEDAIDESDHIAAMRRQTEQADAVLMGRVTFEEMRGYWPNQTDDETGITDYLNRVTKYVVSTKMEEPDWEGSVVLREPLIEEVERLKSRQGADIVVTGSLTLVSALISAGLVDEYRLFTYPVVLGRGQRLFEEATTVPRLKLLEAESFNSGVTLSVYTVVPE